MELRHGFHKFEKIHGVNCYWTTIDDGVAIIDTGNPKNEHKFLSELTAAGKTPENVKYILITHADIDHLGSAAELKRLTGAKIAIHEADAPIARGDVPIKDIRGPVGLLLKLLTGFMKFQFFEPDILLKEGDEIAGLQVIHTPGHTQGSIILYRQDKAIITGDTLLCNRKGQPRGPIKMFTPDMDQAWTSIQKVADLQFETLLPGHGKPLLENADDRIKRLVKSHINQ